MAPTPTIRTSRRTPRGVWQACARLKVAAIDGPSFDKPDTDAIAHRILLGRQPEPVLLLETLTIERLRRHYGAALPGKCCSPSEPLRALGSVRQDGALASVYAWAPQPGHEAFFGEFVEAMRTAAALKG